MTKKNAEPKTEAADRYLFELEFDGAPFCGWQLQAPKAEAKFPSLQGTFEKALSTVLHRRSERIIVQGCGRTDAGVHAEQFFAHADLRPEWVEKAGGEERLRHKLNSVLPPEMVVLSLEKKYPSFHALEDVVSKTYEYRLMQRRAKPVLARGYRYWLPQNIKRDDVMNWELVAKGLKQFEGEHDFLAFASKGSEVKTTVRKITGTELLMEEPREGQRNISLRFSGEGFLKQQVRNMVGTLLEIGQGKRELKSLAKLLKEPEKMGGREAAGFCVPPEGLFLIRVEYPEI